MMLQHFSRKKVWINVLLTERIDIMPACEKCGWDPTKVQFQPYDNKMETYVNTVTGKKTVLKSGEKEVMVGPEGGVKFLHVLVKDYPAWKLAHPIVMEGGVPIAPIKPNGFTVPVGLTGAIPAQEGIKPDKQVQLTFEQVKGLQNSQDAIDAQRAPTTQVFGPGAKDSEDKVTVLNPNGVLEQKPASKVEPAVTTPAKEVK